MRELFFSIYICIRDKNTKITAARIKYKRFNWHLIIFTGTVCFFFYECTGEKFLLRNSHKIEKHETPRIMHTSSSGYSSSNEEIKQQIYHPFVVVDSVRLRTINIPIDGRDRRDIGKTSCRITRYCYLLGRI